MFSLLCVSLIFADPATPIIELHTPKSSASPFIRITGLDQEQLSKWSAKNPTMDDWMSLFRVVVAGENEEESNAKAALFGSYRIEKGVLIFESRFPLAVGTPYLIALDTNRLSGSTDQKKITKTLLIPKPNAPPASIVAVYPSANTWPENTLRMYIHFSAPMSQGHVYEYLKLIREDGTAVVKPFIEIDEELWNPDCTRLTVLFDPGRIKNGLLSKEEAGPNMENGKSYTLQISNEWHDANGRTLKETFQKSIHTGPVDNSAIDPENWKLTTPLAGTRKPLSATFPKPLDRGLLNRMIAVQSENGTACEGEIEITKHETVWSFTPKANWQKGAHLLIVDTRLEDICGNRVGSPFEIDVFRNPTRRLEAQSVKRAFVVK